MKILITGANGQLAREFLSGLKKHEVNAYSREQLDISNHDAVSNAVSYCKPDIVLNCSAYNLVDKAEDDFDSAIKVNAFGVKNLAKACKKSKALLIHYSTDYVFDGTKEDFYTEEDEPNPINKYGESKLLGERVLSEESDDFLLFRVSWVFGKGKQNFLYKLSEWASSRRVLKVVSDQISVPTYTEDIVNASMLAVENGLRGVYHLTNSGYASRYEVARFFLERLGMNNIVLPVTSDYYPSAAKRPYFSAMSNSNIMNKLGIVIPEWKDAVERFMKESGGI